MTEEEITPTMYYTKIEDLPEEVDDFFKVPAISKLTGDNDHEKRLVELRLAYQKYKDRRVRIKAMADVLKSAIRIQGLKKRTPKRLEEDVKDIFLKEKPEAKPENLF